MLYRFEQELMEIYLNKYLRTLSFDNEPFLQINSAYMNTLTGTKKNQAKFMEYL